MEADGTLTAELKHGIENKNNKRSTFYLTAFSNNKTFVLTFVAVLKGLHRADIVRECNSIENFAIYVINN